MAFVEHNENGLVYLTSSLLTARHAFTTRLGGVSTGIFESLNLGSNRGDDPEAVRENYRRVCALMGVGIDEAAVTKQVHENTVRVVTEADRHICLSTVPYEADGLVTDRPGLPLFCFIADCTPALLEDPKHGVIAAVHCGWRSSVADILGVAVEKMRALGAEPSEIRAALGPALGRCCFETDGDVPAAIGTWLGGETGGLWDRRENGKYYVDLRAATARRLLQLGLRAEHIDVSAECTRCLHDKYWSHRYTRGERGSQAAVIVTEGRKQE